MHAKNKHANFLSVSCSSALASFEPRSSRVVFVIQQQRTAHFEQSFIFAFKLLSSGLGLSSFLNYLGLKELTDRERDLLVIVIDLGDLYLNLVTNV